MTADDLLEPDDRFDWDEDDWPDDMTGDVEKIGEDDPEGAGGVAGVPLPPD